MKKIMFKKREKDMKKAGTAGYEILPALRKG